MCVPTFGDLRINAYLQLPEAFRSLSRPSSAPDAKAFPLRSYQLDLLSCEQESRQRKLYSTLLRYDRACLVTLLSLRSQEA